MIRVISYAVNRAYSNFYEIVGYVESESNIYHAVIRIAVNNNVKRIVSFTCECKATAFSRACKHVIALAGKALQEISRRKHERLLGSVGTLSNEALSKVR